MSDITSVIGFKLLCRVCKCEFIIGDHSKPFPEAETWTILTGYWSADAPHDDEKYLERPIGYSEGTGDSFECKWCHAEKWAAQVKALKETP